MTTTTPTYHCIAGVWVRNCLSHANRQTDRLTATIGAICWLGAVDEFDIIPQSFSTAACISSSSHRRSDIR